MRRPSFQFYPADWLGNTNLRRCTHAEKGVWVDVMCLMHDSGEYGLLRWPLADVAQAVCCQVECLQSLIAKGVMKGADNGQECEAFIYIPRSGRRDGDPVTLIPGQPGPLWYSSRMVRDEYVRQHRGEASRFQGKDAEQGEAPEATPKAAPMPPFGDGSSSASASASSKKKYTPGNLPPGFELFWSQYPKKVDRPKAIKAFAAIDPGDDLLATMLKAVESQKVSIQWLKGGGEYIPHPATWLNGRRWEDEGQGTTISTTGTQWAITAGFANRFEAENAGCREHNAHEFRNGQRIVEEHA